MGVEINAMDDPESQIVTSIETYVQKVFPGTIINQFPILECVTSYKIDSSAFGRDLIHYLDCHQTTNHKRKLSISYYLLTIKLSERDNFSWKTTGIPMKT